MIAEKQAFERDFWAVAKRDKLTIQSMGALVLALTKAVELLELDKVALEARLKVLEDRPYYPLSFL